jgi:tetratricopeptide (TPR) repeat protein
LNSDEQEIRHLEQEIARDPRNGGVWSMLGVLLRRTGNPLEALICHRRGIELDPGNSGIWSNLGVVLTDLGRFDEALESHAQALLLAPESLHLQFNAIITKRKSGQLLEALAMIDRALARDPGSTTLRWERALTLLQVGDYSQGLHDYEMRRHLPVYKTRPLPGPGWDGGPLQGRRIFLSTEQGFGDALMVARFVALVKARGGRVLLECRPELRRVLSGLPVEVFVPAGGDLPEFDVHASQMSLPWLCGTTLDSVPPPVTLHIPEESRAKARRVLGPDNAGVLRVGIIWSGRVTFGDIAKRACPLSRFLRFAEVPGVQLYSLQKGPPEDQLEQLGSRSLVVPLGSQLDDFADTAAFLERLDLVIMTDSSVAHLAGTMGRPVWNLVQFMPYWVYGTVGDSCRWYPSMRLFRQGRDQNWGPVFEAAAQALADMARRRPRSAVAATASVPMAAGGDGRAGVLSVGAALVTALDDQRAGRLDQAATLYRHVLEADPDNANALIGLGQIESQAGRSVEALSLIQRGVRQRPALVEVRLLLASLLLKLGRLDAAAVQWRQIIVLDPANPSAWNNLGAYRASQGGAGRPDAIRALRRANICRPDWAQVQHDLALLLRQDDRLDDAVTLLRRVITMQPEFQPAWMNLGSALLALGDPAAGVDAMRIALRLYPDSREGWYNFSNALCAQGNLVGALAGYRQADRLGLALARSRIPATLIDLGRRAEAEAELARIMPMDGTDVATCIELLLDILIHAGRQEEARELFTLLADAPVAGRFYTSVCLTALSVLDLEEGRAGLAATRLTGLRSDNCWLFTVRSLAALRLTLEQQHERLERPVSPDPSRPRLTSTSLGTRGRFAHNVLEYVLLRLYAEKYGYVLETPDWVGGTFFDLNDPGPSGPLPSWLFARRALNDMITGQGNREPLANRDVLSPLFLYNYRLADRDRVQSWLRPRGQWLPWLNPAVTALRAGGRTVVALHIRRGDFVQYQYPITETAWYVAWLHRIWPELENPVLYLASDDLDAVRSAFAAFAPLTLADVAPVWLNLDYLQDFHVLTQADIVGVSATSGFSQLAALLNTRAKLFVEPDMATRSIRPFTPWTG